MTPQEFAEAVAGHTAEERLLREQLSRDPSAGMFEAHRTFAVDPHFDLVAKEGVEVLAGVGEHPDATAILNGVEPVMDHAAREIAGHQGESYLASVLEAQKALEATLAQEYGEVIPAYDLDSWPPSVPPQGESPELLALRGLELERVAFGFAEGVSPDIGLSHDVGRFPIADFVNEPVARVTDVRDAARPFIEYHCSVPRPPAWGPRPIDVEATVDQLDSTGATADSASSVPRKPWDLDRGIAVTCLFLTAFFGAFGIGVIAVEVNDRLTRLAYGVGFGVIAVLITATILCLVARFPRLR
jgi:hypothetical protein